MLNSGTPQIITYELEEIYLTFKIFAMVYSLATEDTEEHCNNSKL
jgi:hypothetical protein